jgi:nitroreductase
MMSTATRDTDMDRAAPAAALDARQMFLRALHFRHACKDFDETRPVPRGDLEFVLEAGRLAPSSLGLEPWRFIVIEDRALRRELRPACWNQSQIASSSAVIAIVALKAELAPAAGYAETMLRRSLDSDAELAEAMQIYRQMAHGDVVAWSVAQCHIAAANMMMAAALIGLDSCPMGGFEPAAVAEVLKLDRGQVEVALLLALGYRTMPQPTKHRLPLRQLVDYR